MISPSHPAPLDLTRALFDARIQTDSLFALVHPDSLYDRPIPERHRIIFYLGHLEAFDWNLICLGALGMTGFHPAFDQLFSFGIDPPPGRLPEDEESDWPSIEEVCAYNDRVRDALDRSLEAVPEQLLHVALEHRLMHAETFAYMLHNLPYECKSAPEDCAPVRGNEPVPGIVDIAGGPVTLGRDPREGFGWDNEVPRHDVRVPGFSLGRYKVTNGEYLRFVDAGADPPHFWVDRGGRWFYRGMFREFPLPLEWPVYVTQKEASDYAEWVGKRLPTEAEFQRAAFGASDSLSFSLDPARDNFDFQRWDPVPVNAVGMNPLGIAGMTGNGWEWTSTPFAPFPGFEPFPFYPGYSANFFDGEHFVLKGASPRTAACMARPSFRNWFRPMYPYMYAGFRVAES
jgi:formylglycine-generating enzyme required for sulfatase activity